MSYNTRFSLEADPVWITMDFPLGELVTESHLLNDDEKVRMVPREVEPEKVAITLVCDGQYNVFEEPCRWPEHENEMRTVSLKMPEVLFILRGEGEETEDLWVKYFKNGKMQKVKAEITYKPFDESKLA